MNKNQLKLIRETIKQTLIDVYGFHSDPEKGKISRKFLDEVIERIKKLVKAGKLPKNPRKIKHKRSKKKND